jgi:putative FmdB family regulatory protein
MPLYEYICRSCEHRFEALVQRGAAVACPRCRSARLERQLSTFAVGERSAAPRCEGNAACAACCDGAGLARCPIQ